MIELDKFIPPSYADLLEEIICRNPDFTWVYTPSTNNQSDQGTGLMRTDAQSYESDQLVHALFLEGAKRSQFFDLVFPFFYFLEDKTGIRLAAMERLKANMLMRSSEPSERYNTPHIDIPDVGYKSLLYYVRDSDGDTFIFNEKFGDKKDLTIKKRVAPKKGRAIVFDSNTWHASSNPRENTNRIVLNLIFKVRAPGT